MMKLRRSTLLFTSLLGVLLVFLWKSWGSGYPTYSDPNSFLSSMYTDPYAATIETIDQKTQERVLVAKFIWQDMSIGCWDGKSNWRQAMAKPLVFKRKITASSVSLSVVLKNGDEVFTGISRDRSMSDKLFEVLVAKGVEIRVQDSPE